MSNEIRVMRRLRTGLPLAAAVLALAGCGGDSEVQLADSPSDAYTHVWITVTAVAFDTAANAAPDDSGWTSFPLTTPVSIDLATLRNGKLAEVLQNVKLTTGTYQSIRLTLADSTDTLADSAASAGLTYNDQLEYTDTNGVSQLRPLQLTTPAALIVSGSFKAANTGFSSEAPLDLALQFNSARDISRLTFGTAEAFVLNSRLTAIDLSSVGKITGTLDLSALTSTTGLTAQAEKLSGDSTYHIIAASTPVNADGSFALYPLPPANYDVVIRGPGAATVIIQGIPVKGSSRAASTAVSLQPDAIALTAATQFTTNVDSTQPVSPTGALLHFYQTLPGTAGVPYDIVAAGLNPLTGRFTDNLALSAADPYVGTYTAGQDSVFTPATPQQGSGTYQIAADAGQFVRTAAAANVVANNGSTPVGFQVTALNAVGSASADSIAGTLTQTTGHYDSGYLVATHNGSVVTSLLLNTALAANGRTGGAFTLTRLPGGTSSKAFTPGLYTMFVLVWNSTNPAGTLQRLQFTSTVDLTQGSATDVSIALD